MGEVPLYGSAMRLMTDDKRPHPYRGTSLIRNSHFPRIAIGPYAETFCRFLGRVGFL